jgi:hypothetical protein
VQKNNRLPTITVDFGGDTGEELWERVLEYAEPVVNDLSYRWLRRLQYRGRDALSQSIALAMPIGLDDKSKQLLLGLLADLCERHRLPIKHFNLIELEQIRAQADDATLQDRWHVESGKSTIIGADDEPIWVIEDILAQNSGLLLSGLPHSTKSLLMLLAALQCVTTRMVWGKFRVPGRVRNVVFVETEDSQAVVKRRIRAFCKGLAIEYPPPGFHLVTPGPFQLVEEGEQALCEIVAKTEADLLVLSTLQGLISGSDWKEQRDMAPINAVSVRLQRQCSLVLLTHSPWSEKRAAGSVTQAANFASLMHFEKSATDEGTFVTVTHDSKDSAQERYFRLRLDAVRVKYSNGRTTTQVRGVSFSDKVKLEKERKESDDKKKALALSLRRDGESVREIAKTLSVSKSTAARWIGTVGQT